MNVYFCLKAKEVTTLWILSVRMDAGIVLKDVSAVYNHPCLVIHLELSKEK